MARLRAAGAVVIGLLWLVLAWTVRRFFVENAVHWIAEHRIDGLRCDAVHAIFDGSERPFLEELAEALGVG